MVISKLQKLLTVSHHPEYNNVFRLSAQSLSLITSFYISIMCSYVMHVVAFLFERPVYYNNISAMVNFSSEK